MPPKKINHTNISLKISEKTINQIEEMSKNTGYKKIDIIERAVNYYYENFSRNIGKAPSFDDIEDIELLKTQKESELVRALSRRKNVYTYIKKCDPKDTENMLKLEQRREELSETIIGLRRDISLLNDRLKNSGSF